VSLTVGTGPFGHRPTGRFDFDPPSHVTFVEVHPRRVRGIKDGDTVVQSERVRLVYRTGSLPRFAFPAEDVRVSAEPEPALDGYVTVAWEDVDAWFEEDDEIVVHPRDPYHRIDVLNTSRRILVRVGGELVGETTAARILFETGLPPRYYLPRADARMELLTLSDVRTGCAYKGFPEHFDVAARLAIAWSYTDPRREAELVRDRICFYQERPEVELEIDGTLGERPRTAWSGSEWTERYRGSSADSGAALGAETTDR
jgi:uncharacterized protein (DUF427 family)